RGEFNQFLDHPVLEGAWMTKHDGTFYLQYSACGTSYTNYALGCYTGQHPLGPFTYQQRNPILISHSGLVNGCAHHSVVEGPGNTLWCVYTTLVGVRAGCERRIGMDPVGFDENGEMFIAGPTETPQFAPGVVADPARGNAAGLLPLTVHQPATASSWIEGREPVYAVDNYIRTWWEAAATDADPWLQIDLEAEFEVSAARTIFADMGLDYSADVMPGPYQYRIEGSNDAQRWTVLCDQSANTEDRHITYDTWAPEVVRYVRLTILAIPPGMRPSVWEFTVFGKPDA
ncbi:MAG TPA: family 43 glycosylhydrolase, partial [Armatimonadota bacterium]